MMKFFRFFFILLISFSINYSSGQDKDSLRQNIKIEGYSPLVFSLSALYGNRQTDQFSHTIGFNAGSAINSTAITLPFSFAVLGNNFINDVKKNQVSDHLLNKNAYEFSYDASAFCTWAQDSFLFHSKAVYGIDVSTGNFTSVRFTDAAFNIIFYGNSHYAGLTADFGGTKLYSYNYDRIGFSAQKKLGGINSSLEGGVKLSLLTIRNGLKLKLEHTTLFTEQNGEYLDAYYDFEYNQSDSANKGRFQSDGAGISVDLHCSWLNQIQTTRFSFYINNLGIAAWNKNTSTFSADSMIRFSGININNLLFSDTASFIHYTIDSLFKNTGTSEQHESKIFALPSTFSFLCSHSVSAKVLLNAGVSYRPYSDLLPLVFVKPQWILSKSCEIGIPFSAGGSSRYAIGFDAMITIKKQFQIIAGSANVLGILLPARTTSSSLFLQTSFQF
ncbi:MAG: hypothetical protein ABIQ74_02475 [Chitinophagales bacterium]